MKFTIPALTAFTLLAIVSIALTADPTEPKPQGAKVVWQTDYAQAMEQAKQEKKFVILDFTGSDWCAPCIKLRREVFGSPEFLAFAEKNLVCVELDFPRKKSLPAELASQNEYLQQKFKIREFPTVIVLNSDGKLLGSLGYQGDAPTAWLRSLNQLLSK